MSTYRMRDKREIEKRLICDITLQRNFANEHGIDLIPKHFQGKTKTC